MIKQYIIYVMRWLIFSVPGAWVLQFISQYMPTFWAMIVSQTMLGMVVFFVDRKIFGGIK